MRSNPDEIIVIPINSKTPLSIKTDSVKTNSLNEGKYIKDKRLIQFLEKNLTF